VIQVESFLHDVNHTEIASGINLFVSVLWLVLNGATFSVSSGLMAFFWYMYPILDE